ncbi:MAG: serine protease [Sphingobium sp.]
MKMTLLKKFGRLFALIAALMLTFVPAQGEEQDVAAVVRGVVRVVIVATKDGQTYFVGHGSGFAVTPDKVITNAHVVEMLKTEPNLVVGIVPSEGAKSYGGKVVAFSPGNDLALIQLNNGHLPVSTFFAGGVTDGQHVTAIGYPGAVDRAQGLSLSEMIQPVTPVKTSGNLSSGRSSHAFDTLLHTAPMAEGNSGGPLVDDCGRVLGVNSFGSLSEGNEATYGFAVSNREVASFLRQAGVQFQRSSAPCRTIAELDQQETARKQEDLARTEAQANVAAQALEQATDRATRQAEQEIIASRENALAVAALMLALSVMAMGGGALYYTQKNTRLAKRFVIGAGVLLIAAIIIFTLRPSFASLDDRAAKIAKAQPASPITTLPAAYNPVGDNICHIDESRSRITVSQTSDVALNWTDSGCVNGNTQYGRDNDGWSRIFVPQSDPSISINSFDPVTGTYKTERFLADAATLDRARLLRTGFSIGQCTQDPEAIARLQQMQSDIRGVLAPQPNERLVFKCTKGKLPTD